MSINKFTPFLPDIKIFCINSDSQIQSFAINIFRLTYYIINIFTIFSLLKERLRMAKNTMARRLGVPQRDIDWFAPRFDKWIN